MIMNKVLIVLLILLCGCSNNESNKPATNTDDIKEDDSNKIDDFVEYSVTGMAVAQGVFLAPVNYEQNHYLVRFDNSGKILSKETIENEDRETENNVSCYKMALDGKTYYYCQRISDSLNRHAISKLIIVDSDNQKNNVYYLSDGLNLPIDPHDVVVFDENHYIICSIDPEQDGDTVIQHAMIQEVSDRNILWQFNSRDYSSLQDSRYTEGDNSLSLQDRGDYMHFNSFAIDPNDGNLLVSFRNQCSIIKINRNDSSIMWILGGHQNMFDMPEDARFLYQHSLSFTDEGNLLLLNNGAELDNASIMELKIDEDNKKVELVRKLQLDYPISNFGEVIKTEANTYLVHKGQSPLIDGETGFDEIDIETGNVNFSLRFASRVYSYWLDYIK